jgi:hypothetical protein
MEPLYLYFERGEEERELASRSHRLCFYDKKCPVVRKHVYRLGPGH